MFQTALKDPKNIKTDIWTPESWRRLPARHIPAYENKTALQEVEQTLFRYPPLILPSEAKSLKNKIADVATGKSFLFQGGDCAESFSDFHPDNIRSTFDMVTSMAETLCETARVPVVKVGRIAGQFAKPRSTEDESSANVTLPSYKGDMINGPAFNATDRRYDPERMIKAYNQSASTLNLLRAFAIDKNTTGEMDFFTAHEALLLPYEQALTRPKEDTGEWYDLSAHFLWIGDRTRQPDGAHVEFLRGVKNPVGLKCGPTLSAEELIRLIEILNPENEAGRLTLISRMGNGNVEKHLPDLVRAVKKEGKIVAWCCDPMHGNTRVSSTGYKTRALSDITGEIRQFLAVHRAEKTHPGGVHFELTGKDVTECTGGLRPVTEETLSNRYETLCDPRLNASQSMEIAQMLAQEIKPFFEKAI